MTDDIVSAIKPLDKDGLYEVRTFTDTVVGDIRVLVPVKGFGEGSEYPGWERDPARHVRFFASVTLSFAGAQFPTSFEIEAYSLGNAIDKCPAAALAAGEAFKRRMDEQRAAARILVPTGSTRQ